LNSIVIFAVWPKRVVLHALSNGVFGWVCFRSFFFGGEPLDRFAGCEFRRIGILAFLFFVKVVYSRGAGRPGPWWIVGWIY